MDALDVYAEIRKYQEQGDYQSALELLLYLAEGDASLDAGSLAVDISWCYEKMGRMNEARYWAGRAREENPTLPHWTEPGDRLGGINIDHLLPGGSREA